MNLFARIQPQKTFHITINTIAKLLGIPPRKILRIELWKYVVFVHRSDVGGQFISYRKLRNWQNAVACKIQKCKEIEQLKILWLAIQKDGRKYKKQYQQAYYAFVKRIWTQQWDEVSIVMHRWGVYEQGAGSRERGDRMVANS